MASKEQQLSLVVKAIDKASTPLRAIAAKINVTTGPLKKWNAELDGFRKAFEPLKPLGDAFGKVGGALKGVGSEIVGLGAKLVGLAAGAGFALFTVLRGALNAGDELATMADRVGLNIDAFASLRFAAAQADVTQEQFNSSLDRLNKGLGEMKAGKGELLGFLNKISPAFAKQVKGAKSTEEAMSLLTDAFAKIDDPQRRAALAGEVFGKSNLQMAEFLRQGSASIQMTQRRYIELMGPQEKFARGAGLLDNALRETGTAFEGLRNAVAGELFPALAKLAGLVTDFVVKNRDGIRKWAENTAAAIQKWVDSGGFERLVDSLSRIADTIGSVVRFLGPMGTAFAGVTVLALPLIAALGNLGIALVGLAIEAFPLVVAGLSSLWVAAAPLLPFIAAGAALALLGKTIHDNWGELSFIFKDWGNSLKWAVLDAWETVRPIIEKLSGFFGEWSPIGLALKAGNALDSALRPPAAGLAPPAATQSESRVSVDFSNVPRGVNVSTGQGSAPIALDVGYSLGAE